MKYFSVNIIFIILTSLFLTSHANSSASYKQRPIENQKSITEGRHIYKNACRYCHGINGKGDGPVTFYLSRDTGPRPRDFTSGVYKFRSTDSGELPMDEDLFRSITRGITGFMPGFSGLPPGQRWKLVYYIKSLNADFSERQSETINIVGRPIPSTAASIKKGYAIFQQFKCWECHGDGRGNGEKAAGLKDDHGFPIPPRDLTRRSSFKVSSDAADIYRTIMSGFDGGPMPAYGDYFIGNEEDLWHLINYIYSLSE